MYCTLYSIAVCTSTECLCPIRVSASFFVVLDVSYSDLTIMIVGGAMGGVIQPFFSP